MKNEHEIIKHEKVKHIHGFVIEITYRNFHTHNDFELLLVLEGHGDIHISNQSYSVKKGDIIVINPNVPHEINGKILCCIIQFSRHFCASYFKTLETTLFSEGHLNPYLSAENTELLADLMTSFVLTILHGEPYFELTCIRKLAGILQILYSYIPHEIMTEDTYMGYSKKIERIRRISSYIDAHYTSMIRLEDLAEIEQVSLTYLSHFFKNTFGVSFQEYLNNKRFENAMLLISKEELNLTQISELCGFSDPKYLNKIIRKKFGCSFREYRKQNVLPIIQNQKPNQPILQRYYPKKEAIPHLTEAMK